MERPLGVPTRTAASWPARLALPLAPPPFTSELDRWALEVARSLAFHVVDLVPGLVERLRRGGKDWRDFILSNDDWHPNPFGHAIVADLLTEAILDAGLVR